MRFKNFEELLDKLLKELEHLRIWSDDIVQRMQENVDALNALDLEDPTNIERYDELLKECDELKAEFERFMEESKETLEKSDALIEKPRGSRDKPN